MMFHSVADVQGLNSITEQVLGNAAHALAGMIAQLPTREACEAGASLRGRPLGITMFGVTTPCVQAVTGGSKPTTTAWSSTPPAPAGGRWRELGDSGLLAGVLDLTTTEVADMLVGGVFPADRGPVRRARSAPACPMSARSARSTWSISGRATPCRRSSAAANSSSTIRT